MSEAKVPLDCGYDPEAAAEIKAETKRLEGIVLGKMDTKGIQVRHFQELKLICGTQGDENARMIQQGASVAFEFDSMGLCIAVALANPIDQFSRHKGRLIAGERLIGENPDGTYTSRHQDFLVFYADDNPIVECEMVRHGCKDISDLPQDTLSLLLGTAVQAVRQRFYAKHLEKIAAQKAAHEAASDDALASGCATADLANAEPKLKPFPPATEPVATGADVGRVDANDPDNNT